jgi:DNA-binding NtrC family response regulator
VFPIEIPPLRTRKEDIPHLVDVILRRLNRFHLKEIHDVHPQVMDAFQDYDWPGNIRELENLMERAYILEESSILTPDGFPNELFSSESKPAGPTLDASLTLAEMRSKAIEDIERRYIEELLTRHRGRINESAQAAGISTRQLNKLMSRYGIRKETFKP